MMNKVLFLMMCVITVVGCQNLSKCAVQCLTEKLSNTRDPILSDKDIQDKLFEFMEKRVDIEQTDEELIYDLKVFSKNNVKLVKDVKGEDIGGILMSASIKFGFQYFVCLLSCSGDESNRKKIVQFERIKDLGKGVK